MPKRPALIPNDDPKWRNKVSVVEQIDFVPSLVPMNPPAPEACNECPFAKDSTPGYLGGYSADMYRPLIEGRVMFACHRSQGFQQGDISQQRQCTGMCHMRANMGIEHHPESPLQAGIEAAGKDERFFGSFAEFKSYHDNT